jgi:hypothetical protein
MFIMGRAFALSYVLSGDFQRRNIPDHLSECLLRQIVTPLRIEPEIGTVSARLPEPQRHDRRDRLLGSPEAQVGWT